MEFGIFLLLDSVVQKLISANQGLKVNRRLYFSCLKMFSNANFKLQMKTIKSKSKLKAKKCLENSH